MVNSETGIYTHYLKKAAIEFDGRSINRIIFQAEFSSYPYEVADSILGIVLELEKFEVPVIKPNWQILDGRIVNQYRIHNALWDVEVNEKISGQGKTNVSIELLANLTDDNFQIAEDSVGVYKSISKLSRRVW